MHDLSTDLSDSAAVPADELELEPITEQWLASVLPQLLLDHFPTLRGMSHAELLVKCAQIAADLMEAIDSLPAVSTVVSTVA
jgi:hypothetical protein